MSQKETGNGVEPAGMWMVMSPPGERAGDGGKWPDGFRNCSTQRGNPPKNAPYLLHYGRRKMLHLMEH
jgi:hypothetical protein